jgi:hypothetical protein
MVDGGELMVASVVVKKCANFRIYFFAVVA